MRKLTIILAAATLLTTACGKRQPKPEEPDKAPISTRQNQPGDSTIYGLACDGCTDSLLVMLPYLGIDPDTFDIITARQAHRIYGRPHIGDELAVIVNPADSAEALTVINMRTLCGDWCYEVMPTFRNIDQMPQRMQRRMMERMPDSVRQRLLVPREYMLRLKRSFSAQARGSRHQQTTTDDMSPVEYPAMKRYTEWCLYNGRLILTAEPLTAADSVNTPQPQRDTADIVMLRTDTLVLRFNDHEQGYYRKK